MSFDASAHAKLTEVSQERTKPRTEPLNMVSGVASKFVYSSPFWSYRTTAWGAPAPVSAEWVCSGVN